MLFVEFIAPLKKSKQADKCLCALYYLKYNLNVEIATIPQVKNLLLRARVVKKTNNINYTAVLTALEEKVDSPATGMWQITPSGEKIIVELLNLPSNNLDTENDTLSLEDVLNNNITDDEVKDYLKEGIDCLKIGKLRASVVFIWSGVIDTIRKKLIKKNLVDINNSLKKYDQKSKEIKKEDDFAYVKESILLLVMMDLGLCDKNQKDMLEQCLDLRNKCGHPGKYSPGPKRVSAFVEDLISIIFT